MFNEMRPVRLREVLWLSQRHTGINSGAGIGTESSSLHP